MSGIISQLDVDLMDLEKLRQSKYRYLLIIINVFTRKLTHANFNVAQYVAFLEVLISSDIVLHNPCNSCAIILKF